MARGPLPLSSLLSALALAACSSGTTGLLNADAGNGTVGASDAGGGVGDGGGRDSAPGPVRCCFEGHRYRSAENCRESTSTTLSCRMVSGTCPNADVLACLVRAGDGGAEVFFLEKNGDLTPPAGATPCSSDLARQVYASSPCP